MHAYRTEVKKTRNVLLVSWSCSNTVSQAQAYMSESVRTFTMNHSYTDSSANLERRANSVFYRNLQRHGYAPLNNQYFIISMSIQAYTQFCHMAQHFNSIISETKELVAVFQILAHLQHGSIEA